MSHRFAQIDADSKRRDGQTYKVGHALIRDNPCQSVAEVSQKFTPAAAMIASTTAMIASPQINPDASGMR